MKHILLSGFMLFGLGVAADARDTQVYDMTVSVYNIPDNMSDLSDHDIFKEAYRSLPSDRYDIQDDITTINTDYPDMMITHGKRIYQKTLENVKQNSKYHILKDENEHIAIFNPSISHKIVNLDKLNNRQIERIKRMEEIPDTGVTMIVNHISSDENNIHVDFETHATNFDDNPVTHKKNKNDDDSEENTDDDNDEKQETINDNKCKDNKKTKIMRMGARSVKKIFRMLYLMKS